MLSKEYINLVGRVKDRMTIFFDISSTGEENVIADNSSEMKDLEYRRKQLERLQNEVIDLEDISGNISLTDFTETQFNRKVEYNIKIQQLIKQIEQMKQQLL